MKKALLPLVCFLVIGFGEVKAQWVTIPDANFVTFLQQQYPACMSGNQMDTACAGVVNAANMDCSYKNISDLTGIEYFKTLDTLICSGNNLGYPNIVPSTLTYFDCSSSGVLLLPPLPSSLKVLNCSANILTVLPSLPVSLRVLNCSTTFITNLSSLPPLLASLDCQRNSLTVLPSLPVNLTYLNCSDNSISALPSLPVFLDILVCESNLLTNLPALPTSLTELYCGGNQLTNLPVLPTSLVSLQCPSNFLTSLPTLPASIVDMACNHNQLTSLPSLPTSLYRIFCHNNFLTTLPPLPSSLAYLICYNNSLSSLPILPPRLQSLICDSNQLTNLPPLPQTLGVLKCADNQLTSIPDLLTPSMSQFIVSGNFNLRCMPPLKKFTGAEGSFSIKNTGINCLPNVIPHTQSIILGIDTMPICNIFNTNGCDVAWNIQGTVYQDSNSNCTRQISETKASQVKLNLYQGSTLVESAYYSGDYSFDTDLSTYTVEVDTNGFPFLFTCPSNGDTTLNITNLDSLKFGLNFGLICKPGFDVGVQSIVGNRFRPSWNEKINISVGDMANLHGIHCVNGVSGEVTLTITGPASYISPAPGALTPNNVSGNIVTWNIADFGTINSNNDFNIIIRPDTAAQAGQQICFTVSVSPTTGDNNPSNNVLTQCFEVRTSYDPNDKSVYPIGNIDTTQNWLTYTIRFQNTGNDTAIHVQIIDTLDSDIDMASFKLLAYSHPNITQILEGGIVKFNFPNIYLPDSNVNEPLSHGYIQYKVKLKDNLPIGTNISNTAYIYFDFNAPVVTNTTTNTISTATAVSPSPSGRGGVGLFPNPAHNTLTILTSGSNETITITNLLGEVMFHERTLNGRKEIDISQWPQGMYFVNQQKFVKQ